jgi:quercetin dioxygenase-like cupin family protein
MSVVAQGESTGRFAIGDVRGLIKSEREDPVAVIEFSLQPGGSSYPAHIHRKIFEITYVVEGLVVARLGEQSAEYGPGTVITAPPGVAHSVVAHGGPARTLTIHSPGALALELFETLGEAFTDRPDPATLLGYIADLDIEFAR